MPFDLLILAPSRVIIPCVNRLANGSRAASIPSSESALTKNRAYIRCRIACSMPPMYWSTVIQWSAISRANGASSLAGSR